MMDYKDNLGILDPLTLISLLFIHASAKVSDLDESFKYNLSCLIIGFCYWGFNLYRIHYSFKKQHFYFNLIHLKTHWDICLYSYILFSSFTITPFFFALDFKLTYNEGITTFALLVCSIIPFRYFHSTLGLRKNMNKDNTYDSANEKLAS